MTGNGEGYLKSFSQTLLRAGEMAEGFQVALQRKLGAVNGWRQAVGGNDFQVAPVAGGMPYWFLTGLGASAQRGGT